MKKFYLLIILITLLSVISYQTLAYYKVSTKTVNIVTTQNIELALLNKTTNSNEEEIILEPALNTVLAGDTFIQKVYVENTGDTNFYTRIKIDTTILDINGSELKDIISFNINSDQWILDNDGWYRYIDVVEINDITSNPLFTEIYFPLEMDEEYNGCKVIVTLQAQCVQAKYNANNISEVVGWPINNIGGESE